jgi:GNAT superfamily N-acetyltransferase
MDGSNWVGGIVLGSTFPNVGCRDQALGLKHLVQGPMPSHIRSPWATENRAYWDALQGIVNHARTFIFPEYQGRGLGVSAHRLLLREGLEHWCDRYPGPVVALDTLCDAKDSGLFTKNGWTYVGRTRGYGSDRSRLLVDPPEGVTFRNNVALSVTGRAWEVWVRPLP